MFIAPKIAERLRTIAPAGYVLALDLTWGGPAQQHATWSSAWSTLYQRRNYFVVDPVFHWALRHAGHKRWSEVGLPDPAGVLRKAATYGLTYGAIISEKEHRKRSFLTVAHQTREFSEPELFELSDLLAQISHDAKPVIAA